jgi:hypothetical protein
VATGRAWQGRNTKERSFLYVAAEGAFGYKARVNAWEQGWHTEVKEGGNIFRNAFVVLTTSPAPSASNAAPNPGRSSPAAR